MYPFRKLTAYILTGFALIIGLYSLFIEYYDESMLVSVEGKLIIAAVFVAALIPACFAFCISEKNILKKSFYIRNFFIIAFVYYLLILLDLLFLDSAFGRVAADGANYIKDYNFVPFATVHKFWYGYCNGNVSLHNMLVNILGNFCAFIPMTLFLSVFSVKCRRLTYFLLYMLLITAGIELVQMFSGLGSCDIDDMILNIAGALICFLLLRLPLPRRLLDTLSA